jgi:hypothetical protein
MSQGTQAGTSKETDSHLEPPKGTQPGQHLAFSPVSLISDVGPLKLKDSNVS